MKAVVKHLQKIFKGKDLDQMANDLDWSREDFDRVYTGKESVQPSVAVKFAKLTGTDPREILTAQMEDELKALGEEKPPRKKVAQEPLAKSSHVMKFRRDF